MVGSVDVIGNARVQDGTVDMGAFEGAGTLVTNGSCLARNVSAVGGADGIAVSWSAPLDGGAVLYRVCRMDLATGQWMPVSDWIAELGFLDTQLMGGLTCRYAIVSAFDIRFDIISGLSAPVEGQRILIPQVYVDASRPNDTGDGRSWATAKKTIQSAIVASTPYDTILVTNGVYTPISTANKGIMIRSVNGAAFTIIDGGWTNRCATLGSKPFDVNTVLVGFTLRNGYASYGGGSYYGTLDNCTLAGNSGSQGGGSYYGALKNCILMENSSVLGGGSYYGTLDNCTLTENSASSGGGAYASTLNNCTLSVNSASNDGGGAYYGTLNNCTLTGNMTKALRIMVVPSCVLTVAMCGAAQSVVLCSIQSGVAANHSNAAPSIHGCSAASVSVPAKNRQGGMIVPTSARADNSWAMRFFMVRSPVARAAPAHSSASACSGRCKAAPSQTSRAG